MITREGKIKRKTEKAVLFFDDLTAAEIWLPRSQMAELDYYEVIGKPTTIHLTPWIAEQKGLVTAEECAREEEAERKEDYIRRNLDKVTYEEACAAGYGKEWIKRSKKKGGINCGK